jgi:hypothetical protein
MAVAKLPILQSAAAGVAFLREHWRAALAIALAAAAASTLVSLLAASAPGFVILLALVDYAVLACAYAALLTLALGTGPLAPPRVLADGARLWAAMAGIGFFLFIVCVVAALPSLVILSVAFAPFQSRIEALGAKPDPDALGALVAEAFQADPWPFLLVVLLYFAAWLLITSRLYLAAPATLANRTVTSFSTWPWTKGAMLRILAARLVLLIPAAVIVVAIQRFAGAALGVNTFDIAAIGSFARANPASAAALQFVGETAQYFVLVTLEAGLSARIFLELKGAAAQSPAKAPV